MDSHTRRAGHMSDRPDAGNRSKRILRTAVVAVAVLVVTGLSSACSFEASFGQKTISTDELERQSTKELTRLAGYAPDSVDCPEEVDAEVGASTRCRLTSGPDTLGFTVTVTSVEGDNVKWNLQVDNAPM